MPNQCSDNRLVIEIIKVLNLRGFENEKSDDIAFRRGFKDATMPIYFKNRASRQFVRAQIRTHVRTNKVALIQE